MADNPLARRDLVAAIMELRQEAERRLLANKYYVAMNKLDELLAAIRPLEIIEATTTPEAPPRQQLEARSETREVPATMAEPPTAEAETEAAPELSAAAGAAAEPRWGSRDEDNVADAEPRTEPEWGRAVEAQSEPPRYPQSEPPEETARPWLEPEINSRAS